MSDDRHSDGKALTAIYPLPPFLGLVLTSEGIPIGTCFQVRRGIFVTALHVVASLSESITIEPLEGGQSSFASHLLFADMERDVAILQSAVGLRESVRCMESSDSIKLGDSIVIAGFAAIDDGEYNYRYIETTGAWLGKTVRNGAIIGRARTSDVLPGMSGAPVLSADTECVVGMVHGRFNSSDGWLRDSVWVCRSDQVVDVLQRSSVDIVLTASGATSAPSSIKAHSVERIGARFADLYYHVKLSRLPDRYTRATELSEELLQSLNEAISIGNIGAGSGENRRLSLSLIDLIDDIIVGDAQANVLLPLRARTRERLGDWSGALNDIQRLADTADLSGDTLAHAGSLLMTLGNYPQASAFLKAAEVADVSIAVRFESRALRAWIDDYQGRHDLAIRNLLQLRKEAIEAGAPSVIIGGADHRIARAAYEKLNLRSSRSNREELQRALTIADRGRRQIPDGNPFSYLWMAKIVSSIDDAASERYWQEGKERLAAVGESARGHLHLMEGARYADNDLVGAARRELWDGLEQWKVQCYPKGVYDAALALGELYLNKSTSVADRFTTVWLLRLAELIAARMQLPTLERVKSQFERAVDRTSGSGVARSSDADEHLRALSYSYFLKNHELRVRDD